MAKVSTELEAIESRDPAKLFTTKGIGPLLKAIELEATAEVPDVSTKVGRERIKSLAYKVARSKTTIDDLGKEHVAGRRQEIAAIDEVRRTARDFLDDLKAKVRQPLTDYEEQEAARVEKLVDRVNRIKDLGEPTDDQGAYLTARQMNDNLEKLKGMKITKSFQEYQDDAVNAKNEAIVKLIDAIPAQVEREHQAEVDRQQAEKEAEDARIEEEQRIAREAVEAADLESKRELEEIQEREAREQAEREERERNTRHKGNVNREAAADLEAILSNIEPGVTKWEDLSKTIVKAIVKGKVRHVTIEY